MKKSSRILAFVLTLLMVVSLMPVSALAEELEPASAAQSLLLPGMTDIPVVEETPEEEPPAEEPEATETPEEETPAEPEQPAETEEPEATEAPAEETEEPEAAEATEETEEAAEEEDVAMDGASLLLAEAVFASDVHASTSAVSGVFSAIESNYSANIISGVGFAGDTAGDGATGGGDSSYTDPADITSAVQTALGDSAVTCVYSYGSHDNGYVTDMTGELYENTFYYVYAISQSDMSSSTSAASAVSNFNTWVESTDKTKPIFILSHQPLHSRRGDNGGAGTWYTAISAAAQNRDITFFWAHNHTGETSVDTAAYYVAKNGTETMDIYNGSSGVTPNFTYMNAGYIGKTGVGRAGVATMVSINSDTLVFQDYNSSGTYTGDYNHNVTVTRSNTVTTEKTLSEITITQPDKVMYLCGDTFDATGMVVSAIYTDSSYETVTDYTVSGYDMSNPGKQTVTVTYGGKTATFDIIVAAMIAHSDVSIYEDNSYTDLVNGTYSIRRSWTCYLSAVATAALDWEITENDDGTYTVSRVDSLADSGVTVTGSVADGYITLTSTDNVYATEGYRTATKTYIIDADAGTFQEDKSGTFNTVTDFIYGVMPDGSQGDTLGSIQATALGLTGIAAVVNTETAVDTKLCEVFYEDDYVSFDVTLTGHTNGNEIDYSVAVIDGTDTTNLELYYISKDADGNPVLTPVKFTLVTDAQGNKYIEFITTYVGTFAYGAALAPDGYTLSSLDVTNVVTTKYFIGDDLDMVNPVVTITYLNADRDEFKRVLYYDYDLDYDMTVAGPQTVTVSYTEGEVTCSDTFDIEIYQEIYADTAMNVTVTVAEMEQYTYDFAVAESANENVASAVADLLKADTYVAYDITMTGFEDNEATVTLPIPNGVTTPVVCYVPDNDTTAINMNATVNEDGTTVSFTTDHFSTYVVGESTEITVPDPTTATVTGATTTTTKTVYVLVSSLTTGKEYMIVSANSTSGYALDADSTAGTSVTINAATDSITDAYIENTDTTLTWTYTSNSYLQNASGTYLYAYENGKDNYVLQTSSSTTQSWTSGTNQLTASVQMGHNTRTVYLTNNSGTWTYSTSSANVYFYEKQTVTVTTTADGTYSIKGSPEEVTATVIPDDTIELGSTLYFVPESGTTTTTDTSTDATYTIYDADGDASNGYTGDPLGVISGISGNTVTFTGNTGKALVKVTYTGTVGETSYTVSNYILITAMLRDYDVTINITTSTTDEDGNTTDTVTPAASSMTAKQGTTLDLSDTAITYVDGNGVTQTVTGEITWTVSDESLATITEDGVVTLGSEAAGNAVTITATWTDPYGNILTDTLTVNIVDAVWALDLCEAEEVVTYTVATAYAEGVTYYTYNESTGDYTQADDVTADNFTGGTYYTATTTTTYTSIKKPIVIKEVDQLIANGTDTYNLWAVITKDGTDIGTLSEDDLAKLTFISSNEDIATVDKTTGKVTFEGGEGVVTITAIYEYADGKSVTDTVIFSVSKEHYYVEEDGTDDFREYPEEGAVRFDKTATAVGNFSKTGIAKVELSMTGVPITEGNAVDVVVMLDMTGSMSDDGMEAAEEATKAFVKTLVINEDGSYNENRVAVYAFNSGSSSPYELVALTTIGNEDGDMTLEAANTAIDTASDKQASGGTPFNEATVKCYDVLKAARTTNLPAGVESAEDYERKQFCVFMSDGGPTEYYGVSGTSYIEINNDETSTDASALATYLTNYTSTDSSEWEMALPKEYYTELMKADGVTVYTVGLLLQNNASNASPWTSLTSVSSVYDSTTDSLTTIGTHYYFTSEILKQMASDEGKYIDIFTVDNAENASAKFQGIAQSILEAATDVQVADKISDDFTMVFDFPNSTVESALGEDQEFYIEVTEYTLEAVYGTGDKANQIVNYVRKTGTSKLKLYLGTASDGAYYAATANGSTNGDNAFAAPAFNQTAIGTKFYWSTDSTKGDSGISVSGTYTDADGNTQTGTFYFVSDGTGDYNMASGAYAYGTPTTVEIIDSETGEITGTNTTCENLIIATPYFVYNASTRMLVWTLEKVSGTEWALSYFLYLEESGGYSGADNETLAGTYETNDYANLTYTNFQNHDCESEFPVPQVTWNGAQVTYVFYLVNEDGEPVNRAGKVIPFSEAVYVTDTYTYSIIWNDFEQLAELDAQYLAEDLVPDVYALYDDDATYDIHVFENEEGENLNNHFVIGGDTETTYVFNTKADVTKYYKPGAYAATTSYKCKDYNVTINDDGSYTYNGNGEQVKDSDGNPLYGVDEADKVYAIIQKTDGTVVEEGFDFANTTVAFAVVWKPELVPDTVVIDFGLPVVIDVATNDALAAGVVGVRADAPSGVDINKGQYTAAKDVTAELTHGTATMESLTSVRYTPKTMTMYSADVFYYESDVNYYTDGTNLTTTSMYSSVTVIPATTIYYEDTVAGGEGFITYTNGTTDGTNVATDAVEATDTTAAVPASGVWFVDGTTVNAVQDQDRPGASLISEVLDADNIYGYDKAYAQMATYSMGSAHGVKVSALNNPSTKYNTNGTAGTWPTASFTFKGSAFDIISLTSNTTGTIVVTVTGTDANGNAVSKNLIVDTYYGYSRTLDENYPWLMYTWTCYAITDSAGNVVAYEWHTSTPQELTEEQKTAVTTTTKKPADDDGASFVVFEENYTWETVVNDPNALYQVPVIKCDLGAYGTYTVTVEPRYSSGFDHTDGGSYYFYMDAVRVYNPAGITSDQINDTIEKAYTDDGELLPEYHEVGDWILSAEAFNTLEDGTIGGVVFVDAASNTGAGNTSTVADYTNYGPNHEVYLAPGQAVVFNLNASVSTTGYEADKVHLAMKSVGNGDVDVKVWDANESTADETAAQTIKTATDMYYDISELNGGTVVIMNTSADNGAILSITNVKITSKVSATTTSEDEANLDGAAGDEATEDTVFTVNVNSVETAIYTMRSTAMNSTAEDNVSDDTTTEGEETGTDEDTGSDEEEAPGDEETGGGDAGDDNTDEEVENAIQNIQQTVKKVISNIKKILAGILSRLGR